MGLAERLHEVLDISPDAGAIEFEGKWRTWGEHGDAIRWFEAAFSKAGLDAGAPVGVVIRNRPPQAAAAVAIVGTRRMLVTVNPHQSPGSLAEDFAAIRAPALIMDREDWAKPEIAAAARQHSRLVLVSGREPGDLEVVHDDAASSHDGVGAPRDFQPSQPAVAIQMLTSGTTGKPKRINLSFKDLEAGIWNITKADWAKGPDGKLKVNTTPGLIYAPFGHIAGLWFLFFLSCDARPFVLLERFNVEQWASAVKRHKLKNTGLVPSAMRMVLDANVPKEDIASLVAVGSGTAPLPVPQWEEFESRYGIAVLPTYGSTEFAGAVVCWTMKDHKQFIATKRGAAGKAIPGNTLRIVDQSTFEALPKGQVGLVEVSSNQLNDGAWVRTTDLGYIDQDDFLFIQGRADGAINRGGFKIVPSEIEEVLRRHPDVLDAAAVGIPDPRLGQIPAVAVEPRPGHRRPTPVELEAFAREHLVTYKVPARILVLDALPRTPSMKPILPALRELFAKGE